jgi:hypothetical protein
MRVGRRILEIHSVCFNDRQGSGNSCFASGSLFSALDLGIWACIGRIF